MENNKKSYDLESEKANLIKYIKIFSDKAVDIYREKINKNYSYIPKKDKFPTLGKHDSGLPYFSLPISIISKKVDFYQLVLNETKEVDINHLNEIAKSIMSKEGMFDFFNYRTDDYYDKEQHKSFLTSALLYTFENIAGSCIHLSNLKKPNARIIEKLVNLWINSITFKKISFDIYVPIIIAQPLVSQFKINNNISIIKMSERFQLSRNIKLPNDFAAHEDIIGACTHAFKISNHAENIPNTKYWSQLEVIKEVVLKNRALISSLFVNLSIVLKRPIGYCQIVAKAIGAQQSFNAELYDLKVFAIKNYSVRNTKDYRHLKIEINKKELFQFKKLVQGTKNKSIELAERKLFSSYNRDNSLDSILDLSTAFETLLTNARDNLRFKVALRTAIICKKHPFYWYNPIQIKGAMLKFYDLRSSIIHTGKSKKANEILNFGEDGKTPTLYLCTKILEHLIKTLKLNQNLLNPQVVDNLLLE